MRILSLFSGIGGMDLGIKLVLPQARTIAYCEADGYCQRVLHARMRDGSLDAAPLHGDARTFDGRPWRGCVDMVVGGFPCQPVSLAGKRRGTADERWLWPEFARIIGEVRPRYVYVENVAAITVRGVDAVLGSLAELRYDAEWLCLSASAVGAPHRRNRWFCLAHAHEQHGDTRRPGTGAVRGERGQASGVCSGERADVAHCHCQPEREQEHETGSIAWSDEGQNAGRGRERLADSNGAWQSQPPGSIEEQRGWSRDGSAGTLGNAIRAGLEEWLRVGGDAHAQQPSAERASAALFPPGPGDEEGWERVLGQLPGLSPSITEEEVESVFRGVAHGFPLGILRTWRKNRTSRLRALGNGCVPLQSAVALALLAARIER
jgi:DNA (cytosine-5)-methyltransferase 1